jgi:hypothetical protein
VVGVGAIERDALQLALGTLVEGADADVADAFAQHEKGVLG